MKKFSKSSLNLAFLLINFIVLSQAELQIDIEGRITTMEDHHIASDFGRREGGSRFHDGVDFTAASGDDELNGNYDIMSISTGRVRRLSLDQNYKVIIIDDGGSAFGYGHIFRSNENEVGNFLIYNSIELEENVIIYNPGNSNNTYALTDLDNIDNLSFTHTYGNADEITYSAGNGRLRNTVNAGDRIAPIGDSGENGTTTYPAHIHLYRFRSNNAIDWLNDDNLVDPLFYINNYNRPGYDVTMEIKESENFDGGNHSTNPSFRVRADFQSWTGNANGASNEVYQNAANDLNLVRLLIKPSHEATYNLIQGAYFDSYISEGAVFSGDGSFRYPKLGNPTSNTGDDYVDIRDYKSDTETSAGFGDFEKTGIVGASYSGGLPPHVNDNYDPDPHEGAWDDYFFNDFPTRINKDDYYGRNNPDMASEISEARYPDGEYHVLAEAQTIHGVRYESNNGAPQTIIIDNFRPYVDYITLYRNDESGAVVYNGYYDEETFRIEGSDWNKPEDDDYLFASIAFSEPMDVSSVKVKLASQGDDDYVYAYNYTIDQKSFDFRIHPIGSDQIDFQQILVIVGEDLNGNQLQTDPSVVSIRQDDTNWSPAPVPGEDTNHTFNGTVEGCEGSNLRSIESGECIFVAFEVTNQTPDVYESIVFTSITTDDKGITYQWDFGTGSVPATSIDREATVMYTSSGSKIISLTVCSDGNCATETVTNYINVGGDGSQMSIDFTLSGSANRGIGEPITLNASVGGSSGNLTYYWNFGGGISTNFDVPSPTVAYDTPGNKTVSLTVFDNENGEVLTKTKNDFIIIASYYPPLDVSFSCPSNGNGIINLDAYSYIYNEGSDGVIGNETVFWKFSDGQTSSSLALQVIFESPGYYDIILTVCDDSGCDEETCTYRALEEYFPINNVMFTINGNLAGYYGTGSYYPYYQPDISVGLPIVLNDATGNVLDQYSESDIHYYVYKVGAENPFLTLEGPGPHTITLPDPWYQYDIFYQVGAPGFNWSPNAYIYADESSQIGDNCIGTISSLKLDQSCWSDTNRPSFLVNAESNCSIDFIELIDKSNERTITTSDDGLLWRSEEKPDNFPYTTNVQINAYYCLEENNCYAILTGERTVTLYEYNSDNYIPDYYQLCHGASIQIGPEDNPQFSYEWISLSGDINYLSDRNAANPFFTAYSDGTYLYALNITDNQSGCSGSETITIAATGIGEESYTKTLLAGTQASLTAPFSGGGPDYEYEWTPSTYLDNPNVANPVFTAPDYASGVTYTVTASFRDNCIATSSVVVSISNPPPTDLVVSLNGGGYPVLNWSDNSIEQYFLIERSSDGGNTWETLGYSDPDDPNFFNYQCLNWASEYCYRVKAYDLRGSYIGVSNSSCITLPFGVNREFTYNHQAWGGSIVNKPSIFNNVGANVSHVDSNEELIAIDGRKYTSGGAEIGINWFGIYDKSFSYIDGDARVHATNVAELDFWPTGIVESHEDNTGRDWRISVGIEEEEGFDKPIMQMSGITKDGVSTSTIRYSNTTSGYPNTSQGANPYDYYLNPVTPVLAAQISKSQYAVAATVANWNPYPVALFICTDIGIDDWSLISADISYSLSAMLADITYHDNKVYVLSNLDYQGYIQLSSYEINGNSLSNFNVSSFGNTNTTVTPQPKLIVKNDYIYIISRHSSTNYRYYKFDLELNQIARYDLQVSRPEANIISLEAFDREIVAIVQDAKDVGFISFNQNGVLQSEKYYNEPDLDFLMGTTIFNDKIVLDFIKPSTDNWGLTASSIYGLEAIPEESISVCQEDIETYNEFFFAEKILVANSCEVNLEYNANLTLVSSEEVVIKPGFHSKIGSNLNIISGVVSSCEGDLTLRSNNNNFLEDKITLLDNAGESSRIPDIRIYPNPTEEYLKLKYEIPCASEVKILIVDLKGTLQLEAIYKDTDSLNEDIYIGHLSNGLYLLKTEMCGEVYENKIIIH